MPYFFAQLCFRPLLSHGEVKLTGGSSFTQLATHQSAGGSTRSTGGFDLQEKNHL